MFDSDFNLPVRFERFNSGGSPSVKGLVWNVLAYEGSVFVYVRRDKQDGGVVTLKRNAGSREWVVIGELKLPPIGQPFEVRASESIEVECLKHYEDGTALALHPDLGEYASISTATAIGK